MLPELQRLLVVLSSGKYNAPISAEVSDPKDWSTSHR